MSNIKMKSLSKATPVTDSDSAIAEDEDDFRGHRKLAGGKDKVNRNLSEKKRRDQFNMLVNELCTMVSTTNKKMDKSTVLKCTISFLKDHQETANQAQVHEINEDWKPSFLTNDEFMHLMLEALDSFLLVFNLQGVILYTSESVTSLLGHLPSDMLNRSIYEYIDKSESASIHNILHNYRLALNSGADLEDKEDSKACFECNFRRGYIDPSEPVRFDASVVRASFKQSGMHGGDESSLLPGSFQTDSAYFLCTVRLKGSQLVREMSIVDDNKEFTSRHSLEWKFLFLDHRAPPIIGYLPFEVLGTSGYDYYHPDDLDGVTVSHEQLMKKGEGTSCYYRFLTKGQQWIWLRTRFYITYHQWNSKPEFINCTNTVVSYADVRSHKRKEMGVPEDEAGSGLLNFDSSQPNKISRCSSICSATSGSQSEACGLSDKESSDRSQHPTSTSQVRSRTVSQQLQQFLQRHMQQQSQQSSSAQQPSHGPHTPHTASASKSQQQAMPGSTLSQNSTAVSNGISPSMAKSPSNGMSGSKQSKTLAGAAPVSQSTTTTFASLPLQQLMHTRQKQESTVQQPQRILPRPPSTAATDAQVRPMMMPTTSSSPSSGIALISNPSLIALHPAIPESVASNVFMTPIQKQLHEQLQQKASQVQTMIFKQQEELKRIHQQLLFAQGSVTDFCPASPDALPPSGITDHNMARNVPTVNSPILSPMVSPSQTPLHPSLSHHQQQHSPTVHHHQQQSPSQISSQIISPLLSPTQTQIHHPLSLHQPNHHQQQQQHQQQTPSQIPPPRSTVNQVQGQGDQVTVQTVPLRNVAMHNIMVNQTPVLSFPLLPQDSDLYLRLSQDSDSQQ